MIRLQNIKIKHKEISDDVLLILKRKAAKILHVNVGAVKSLKISKKSIDAREKPDIKFVFSVDVEIENEADFLHISGVSEVKPYAYIIKRPVKKQLYRPVIIGCGPAGIFAGLILAEAGLCPVILERGQDVDCRKNDVETFWKEGILNKESNVQFGEGGAGAFSDGKLTTGIKDERKNKIIAEFLEAGAPAEIGYLAKPHIGTDKLSVVIKNMRKKIIELGGEIRFGHKLIDFQADTSLKGITVQAERKIYSMEADKLILAIGHSARDTVKMLYDKKLNILPKAFSAGVRIEHKQSMINQSQYGMQGLGAAEYKLSTRLKNGRGVYSFCMCPGGEVVAAASEAEMVVTNGMSSFGRNLDNANAALLVSVTPQDFESSHPLGGIEFQRRLESDAYRLGGSCYKAPAQLVGDFLNNRPTTSFGGISPSYRPGVTPADLREILGFLSESLAVAILELDKKLNGFACYDAVMTGVETRSSSPIVIQRDLHSLSSISCKGIYPCGEGAGYAGGIMSAAVDGIRCAEKILEQ